MNFPVTNLEFSFVQVATPIPMGLPTSGTLQDAQRLAKDHACVILLNDHQYARDTMLPPFRGSIGPDGSFTKQNLTSPGQSLETKRVYRMEPDHREIFVWGESGRRPTRLPDLDFGGRDFIDSFRTASAEGFAIEECTTPSWYVLAMWLSNGSQSAGLVHNGDALAAAVDAAGEKTVQRALIYTLHRSIQNTRPAIGEVLPDGYGHGGVLVGVAHARDR